MTKQNLSDRLKDPTATFTQTEIYQLFEQLADQFGFYRDDRLPKLSPEQTAETATIVVENFEHLGAVVVRPRTLRDLMVVIPSLCDRILGDNMKPSDRTQLNARVIAIAQTFIVSPPGFVDRLLQSSKIDDLAFFYAFSNEYEKWSQMRDEEALKKKTGRTTGKKSASSSETGATSSQQTNDG